MLLVTMLMRTSIPATKTKLEKYFPIKTATACKLKWGWSTLYLNQGSTASCHRSSISAITKENFFNFHNTDTKLEARRLMLEGQWPTGGCEYCQGVEAAGGFSDRMLHNSIPELFYDSDGVYSKPAMLEVYFNNTCNLSCVYCSPHLSSRIELEYKKFGAFDQGKVKLIPLVEKHIKNLDDTFWEYLEQNFHSLQRFHLVGGEPLYQTQFDKFIEFVDKNPNPNCEFSIISNLMVSKQILESKIAKIKKLVAGRKLKKFHFTASIDCWGKEQEYARYGLNLDTWKENFLYLVDQKWLVLNINQTISVLTIKTMPELLQNLSAWRQHRKIGHYFSVTEPGPSYLRPNILGSGVFDNDFENILKLMPTETDDDQRAVQYMKSIGKEIESNDLNVIEVQNLFIFLNENDRRRSTSWQQTFPWLKEFEHVV